MILTTHIVASGGVITNDKDEVLLVKNPRKVRNIQVELLNQVKHYHKD